MQKQVCPAFTIIELLLSVAIVGILAALATAAYVKVIDKTKDLKCLAHLRQLGSSGLLYATENDGRLPKTYLVGSGNAENSYFFDAIAPYIGADTLPDGRIVALSEIFRCPKAPNWSKGNKARAWSNFSYVTVAIKPYADPRLSNIKPASTVALLDSRTPDLTYGLAGAPEFDKYVPDVPPSTRWRHRSGLNAVYWDGHAENIPEPTFDKVKPSQP